MSKQSHSLRLPNDVPVLLRSHFPRGFVFGTASSSYQYEGAADKRGKNIWDTFCDHSKCNIKDGSNGKVAVDFHSRYKDDVRLMKVMGVDAFRFSISWSRILPNGKRSAGISEAGVKFYNDLINELLANGIQPYVTIFHWDLPQPLEDKYGGFLSRQIVADFSAYADLCFNKFGDRVKHWITINEPWAYCYGGYVTGRLAPGHCTVDSRDMKAGFLLDKALNYYNNAYKQSSSNLAGLRSTNVKGFDDEDGEEEEELELESYSAGRNHGGRPPPPPKKSSSSKPYTVAYHQLLCHATAVNVYRNCYKERQKGIIGITLVTRWYEPLCETKSDDRDAASRALDFCLGWFMDPLTTGDFPDSMKSNVGDRLPTFSTNESRMVKGSFDFIGLNYYTANYATNAKCRDTSKPNYITDSRVELKTERDGVPIGPKAASEWLYIYPQGLSKLLLHMKNKYNNPPIYITENGMDEINEPKLSVLNACLDRARIDYHYRHLCHLSDGIKNKGVNVKGYFSWSLLDNFEWSLGYTVRFGLCCVDYQNGLRRYPKLSSLWFKLLHNKYEKK